MSSNITQPRNVRVLKVNHLKNSYNRTEIVFTEKDALIEGSPLWRANHGESWVDINCFPKGSEFSELFMKWIKSNVLQGIASEDSKKSWEDFSNRYKNEGYIYGVAVVLDKLMSILGFKAEQVASFVFNALYDNKAFNKELCKAKESSKQVSNIKRRVTGDTYSKKDYRELLIGYFWDCREEGDWRDVYPIHPNTKFSCAGIKDFSDFTIEKGIFKDRADFEAHCRDYRISSDIGTMWDVLDLLESKDLVSGYDDIDLLCDYADLHKDFAEASYAKCKEYMDKFYDKVEESVGFVVYEDC